MHENIDILKHENNVFIHENVIFMYENEEVALKMDGILIHENSQGKIFMY